MREKGVTKEDIETVLREVSRKLSKHVRTYLIGGCAMTFRNLKPATKDADLLLEDELSEQRFFQALTQVGFKELFPGASEVPLKAKDILVNNQGLQFDLFVKQVRGGLRLSAAMKKRTEKHAEYGNLEVFLAAKEDIYLFKAVTDRPFPRDFEDLLTLQQSGLNWKAIVSEYNLQVRATRLEQNLRKKLDKLKKQGITNPLLRQVV